MRAENNYLQEGYAKDDMTEIKWLIQKPNKNQKSQTTQELYELFMSKLENFNILIEFLEDEAEKKGLKVS